MICTGCKLEKSEENFSWATPGKRKLRCKVCLNIWAKNNYHANPLKQKERKQRYKEKYPERFKQQTQNYRNKRKIQDPLYFIKLNYNITDNEYKKLQNSQNNCCAICNKCVKLHVDHNHKCCPNRSQSCGNCIRGLLCGNCNRLLGLCYDSKEILSNAIEYLNKSLII